MTGAQIKAGSLGGAQIDEASLAGVSAGSIGNVIYTATSVAISSTAPSGSTGIANCPAGTYVIGGGATVSNEELAFVNDSGPTAAHTGWTATAFAAVSGTTMSVTAICTPVTVVSG